MNYSPPKWADRFLQWYCNPDLLEEIQGDAYELYIRRVKDYGKKKADRQYAWDIIRFFRWSNIKKDQKKYYHSNNTSMFKNYIKVGFRNLTKHWVTSSINIFGLAIGIGCAITTFIFVDSQTHMDSFHENRNNIYQVINMVNDENKLEMWGDAPLLLGPALKDKYPSIERMARVEYRSGNVRQGKNVFSESIMFVDPDFLQMFDFPIRFGNKSVLNQKESIVINDKIATKYFGDEDPMGKTISIKHSNGQVKSYFVGAVLGHVPFDASFRPQILIPISNFFDFKLQENYSWKYLTDAVFIQTKLGSSPLDYDMEEFKTLQNATDSKWPIEQFEFIALKDLYLRAYEIKGSIAMSGDPSGRLVLGIIAVLLLILACFNYMNISVASATKRIKEIAMRKVMGSARRNIINQFLLENLVLCGFALILGIALSYYVFLPGSKIVNPEMEIPFRFSSLPTMIGFLTALLVVVGLASGAYPALYISKFEPVNIFSGSQKFGNKSLFSKVLLTFQLFFAITTVVACFVYADHAFNVSKTDWGYNPEGVISVRVSDKSEFQKLKSIALKNPSVKSVAGSYGHVGVFDPMTKLDYLNNQFRIVRYKVDAEYFDTNNLRLKEGRFFDQESERNSIVINEKFAKKMGWDNPLNESIVYDSIRRNVVGVVKDFHYDFFYSEIYPVIFLSGKEGNFRYVSIKTDSKNELEVDDYLANAWQNISPNDPYKRKFQTDVFDTSFKNTEATTTIFLFISVVALLLASLGLFGLLSFNLQKRMKEYGVRKVLGANAINIAKLANKEYFWSLFTSFLIGAPLGYGLMNQLITSFSLDSASVSITPIVAAIIIILVTFAITVSSQIWKATRVNPAEILRSE